MLMLLALFFFISFSENESINSISEIGNVSVDATFLTIEYKLFIKFIIYSFSGGPSIEKLSSL